MAVSYSHEITGYSKTLLDRFIKNRWIYPNMYNLTWSNIINELDNKFYITKGQRPNGYNNITETWISQFIQQIELNEDDGVLITASEILEFIKRYTGGGLRNYVYILKKKIKAPLNPEAAIGGNINPWNYSLDDFEEMSYSDFLIRYNTSPEKISDKYYMTSPRVNIFKFAPWDSSTNQRDVNFGNTNILLSNNVVDDKSYILLDEVFSYSESSANHLIPGNINYSCDTDDVVYGFLSQVKLTGQINCQISEYNKAKFPFTLVKLRYFKTLMKGICDNCYFSIASSTYPSDFRTGRKADNTFWNILEYDEENTDPYSGGGYTEPSSPSSTGTWTRPHNTIDGNPTGYNDLDAGLFRVYSLTKQQLSAFANKLWNPAILEAIAQHFSDPTGVVISLHSFPFIVPHNQYDELIQFNWIPKWLDGVEVKGYSISEEYYTVDFGDIKIDRFSGTFYDYQPFSSAQLYLPYIGFVNLKMNEILDATLNIKYNINLITGDFTANVMVKNKVDPVTKQTFNLLIGCYSGNMARPLPLSRQDMLEVYKTGAQMAITVAQTAMGINNGIAAASAAKAAGERYNEITNRNIKAAIFNARNKLYNFNLPNLPIEPQPEEPESVYDSFKNGFSSNNNSSLDVSGANAPIGRSGSLGSVLGRCTEQTPFILLSYPHQNVSEKQGKLMGYATNLSGTLEDFTGYTEVREIWLSLPTATSSELAEVEKILNGGIII